LPLPSTLDESDQDMANSTYQAKQGQLVKFRIRDIYLPQPFAILEELHGNKELKGKVLEVSDGGKDGTSFLVVEVKRLREWCVLPMDSVKPADDEPKE
jgi:hypothetical protein